MTSRLTAIVADELAAPVPDEIGTVGRMVAERLGGVAVLFYGSILRTGDLDGVLDFYVLTPRRTGSGLRQLGMALLWPDVSYHEIVLGGRLLRAKVATLPLATFERATQGRSIDTTIWTRFVQPAALVWRVDAAVGNRVVHAVVAAAVTAARFAATLGPAHGTPRDYWAALFRATYEAELRVEKPGRETQILDHDPARYDALLPLAWEAGGLAFDADGQIVAPRRVFEEDRRMIEAWLTRVRLGKALNLARLVKAAFTFEGAARYGLWKIERHTGVRLALTPWRERHPILAAPGVVWRVVRHAS